VYVCPVGLGGGTCICILVSADRINTKCFRNAGDMDLRSIVPNDMKAGHHRPTQIIAERPARFFMFIDLKTFIALDRRSTWRSRICLLKRQTRKPW
jgi:hypothetical protein